MFYVYILNSLQNPQRFYMGFTGDIKQRLKTHNEGRCTHTKKFRPWKCKNIFAFNSEKKAILFEKYLKTSSGRAFSKKHF